MVFRCYIYDEYSKIRIIMATTLFQGTPVALAGEFIQKGGYRLPTFHW